MKLTDLFEAKKQQKPQSQSKTKQRTDFAPDSEFDFNVNMEPKQDQLPSDAPKEKKSSEQKSAKPRQRQMIDPINIQGAPSINFDLLPDDEVSDEDALENLLNDIRGTTSSVDTPRPKPKTSTDLATINKDVSVKKTSSTGKEVGDKSLVNPNFLTISELPGYMVNGIRALGRSVFNICTSTKLENIEIIANVQGQGPHTNREINAVVNWVHTNAPEDEQMSANASINFGSIIPGYQPDVRGYTSKEHTYLMVEDPYGRYVFRWPVEDTKEVFKTNKLEVHRPRLK